MEFSYERTEDRESLVCDRTREATLEWNSDLIDQVCCVDLTRDWLSEKEGLGKISLGSCSPRFERK
jgi:hypothetical protein